VDELKIRDYVVLMPRLGQRALADAYHSAQVMVSPSTHDGTPNTLLEAMACGCFPVLGDIESVREWVTDGENGLLVDARDPQALATAIIQALKDHKLRARAAEINQRSIAERADYRIVMQQVEAFYSRLVS
jgi:glycosyltransferase involved in cell wall biosynthesis